MKLPHHTREKLMRPTALLLSASLTLPIFAGCGGQAPQQTSAPPPPPAMRSRQPMQTGARQGMSGKQKVMLLAGAAALYYIYKKRQNAQQAAGPNGKYFLSKNGRVYYRDLKTGKFQFVSPPRQAIEVPMEEAKQYNELSRYQGYNNQPSGTGFGGYGSAGAPSYNDAMPAQY